jgi:cephalosporin-C deacetylase-like acetyl esterase
VPWFDMTTRELAEYTTETMEPEELDEWTSAAKAPAGPSAPPEIRAEGRLRHLRDRLDDL